MNDLHYALHEAREYFDNRADADCDQDGYIPNEEMRLLSLVNDAIAEVERYRNGVLEEAAAIADQCAASNKSEAAKQARRSARLGGDPFGHGENAQFAADELQACANEAEAIAALIRTLKHSERQP